jgi:hypothetical protein
VRSNRQPTSLIDDLVGSQDIAGRTDLCRPAVQLVHRNLELDQQMLDCTNLCLWGENAQDVEPKGCRELESGQNEDLVQQPAVLGQLVFFILLQAFLVFQPLQLLDLFLHLAITGHRIVIGDRQDVHTTFLGLFEYVQVGDAGLLIVRRSRRMEVKVHPPPLVF